MPTEIPKCANSVKGNGCPRSDVRLLNETEEAWVFQCKTCKLLQVVSKDGVRDRSRFDHERKKRDQQMELERLQGKRKKYF